MSALNTKPRAKPQASAKARAPRQNAAALKLQAQRLSEAFGRHSLDQRQYHRRQLIVWSERLENALTAEIARVMELFGTRGYWEISSEEFCYGEAGKLARAEQAAKIASVERFFENLNLIHENAAKGNFVKRLQNRGHAGRRTQLLVLGLAGTARRATRGGTV